MTDTSRAGSPRTRLAGRLNVLGLLGALVLTPVIFAPQLYDDFTLPKQAVLLFSAALLLAGFALGDGAPLPVGRLTRFAAGAWLVVLLLGLLFAIDPRGSILGVYQYRQGLLTQVAYLVVFAGSAHAARNGRGRLVAALPAAGLGGVFLYTALQSTGNDPIEWWVDTSARAIGTIGNANELAAYAVIALAVIAPCLAWRHPARLPFAGAVAAASVFIVLESQSRAGIGALAAYAVVFPIAWWLAGNPLHTLRRPALALAAGALAGLALSLASGGLAGSASRIEGGLAGSDAGGSTRFSLWEGTTEVIRHHPVTGVGPDSLFLDFPVHRPEGLTGAFERYDLVAQSSHNYILDITANAGMAGLLAMAGLVIACSVTSVRRTRKLSGATVRAEPAIWAALAAYGAMTLLNPISLAAHVLFFALLGLLAAPPARMSAIPAVGRRLRLATLPLYAALACAFLAFAAALPLADLAADDGWEDLDAQRFEQAVEHYDTASNRMPFSRHYAQNHAEAVLAAAVDGGQAELRRAEKAYTELDSEFGLQAGDALSLAAVKIMLGDTEAASELVDRALRLNPHGIAMADYTARLRIAISQGNGVLRYSQRDHWTYIDLEEAP